MFYVGQKVIYVNDRRSSDARHCVWDRETFPKVGSIYTIRAIVECRVAYGYDEDGLLLMEIVNRPDHYVSPRGRITHELAFRVSRFRPIQTTSIDVFTDMLEPVPVREPELV